MGSFWQAKTKIRPTDRLFSKYIKLRDKGLCQYNFKCFRGTPGIDASHFQKRRKETVRFDPNNVDLACRSCHLFVETSEGKKALEAFKKNQLGEQGYNLLLIKANQTGKRDDFMTKLYIKQLMKDL